VAFLVRFLPENRSVTLEGETDLFVAAASCDIWIEQPCGSKASCGKCRVRLVEGDAAPTPADLRLLAPDELGAGWRLGCQLTLSGNATLEVPPTTRAVAAKSFGDDSLFGAGFTPNVSAAGAFGLAVDIGSTTLAAALVDLASGRVTASSSVLNPQVRYGADVISRIHFAQEHPDGNATLHKAVIDAISDLTSTLCGQTGVDVEHVRAVTCAGNATMTHAAAGADITPLGHAPYLGLWTEERVARAADLGLSMAPGVPVIFLPMVRSHVGGDTVAAILASGLDQGEGWRLLVDLGTNSEVVVGHRTRLVATSTAAGPAFEGANIHHGMRAGPGAIDAVRVMRDGRIVSGTVAGDPPCGLCGSGLVDAVAELRRVGVIDASGYMRKPAELGNVPPSLAARVATLPDGQRCMRLTDTVWLTALDVRQLQLVKGSISAGMALLMRECGIAVSDLDEVMVAGAFGNFLKKTSAMAIGLVPDIDPERVRFIGNAAGVGARMVLVDRRARDRARRIAARCEYVELGGRADYQEAFVEAMALQGGSRLET
jgi:uncharacterized 2Fe-2S/4Fe-4S cluster protein (DUF4445 family)